MTRKNWTVRSSAYEVLQYPHDSKHHHREMILKTKWITKHDRKLLRDTKYYTRMEWLDSSIFDEVFSGRRSAYPPRTDTDDQVVRWTRNTAISTLSLPDWDMTGSRVTLLSHASSYSSSGSTNDVTPSPTSDFRCLRTPEGGTPSASGASASSNNEEAGNGTLSLERKRKRKWKRHLTAGASNTMKREQPYRRLDDNEWVYTHQLLPTVANEMCDRAFLFLLHVFYNIL